MFLPHNSAKNQISSGCHEPASVSKRQRVEKPDLRSCALTMVASPSQEVFCTYFNKSNPENRAYIRQGTTNLPPKASASARGEISTRKFTPTITPSQSRKGSVPTFRNRTQKGVISAASRPARLHTSAQRVQILDTVRTRARNRTT